MSRIGKQPINIPDNVKLAVSGNTVNVEGPKGKLFQNILSSVTVSIEGNEAKIIPQDAKSKENKAIWGLTRMLIANMIEGVTKGFEKKLEINGVGYKAAMQGKKLILNIGFSHSVEMESPEGIEVSVEKNLITVKGINKYLVGETAAKIRSKKKPEPYKGKGIKYVGEVIRRKAGKKTAK